MSLAKSFSDEQTAMVQSWADQGDSLSDIQKKLAADLDVKVTYMELRFLLDDLGVELKPEEKPEPADTDEESEDGEVAEVEGALSGNDVKVSISALQRPGALISGTAMFAGGQEAEWWLDQMGQLGLNPKNEDFRPNSEQMATFQKELQQLVQQQGY